MTRPHSARRHPGRRLERDLQRRRRHHRGRPMGRLGGIPGVGRAVREHPRSVHGSRSWRGVRLHGARHQPAHPGVRHGRGGLPHLGRAGRGGRHPGARAQRAGVHLPASRRVHHERPRGRHRGRLEGPRVRPGRPLPVQRQEVRRRPGRRHRHAAQGHPRCARRGLRQHRHRLIHAGRPFAAERGPRTAGQLHPRRRALGAHPGARSGGAHGVHRR